MHLATSITVLATMITQIIDMNHCATNLVINLAVNIAVVVMPRLCTRFVFQLMSRFRLVCMSV